MKKLALLVVLAAVAATAWAQTDTMTFKDGKDAAENVEVFAVTNDGVKPMGTTGAGGVLAGIDPSWFTAKPHGDVVVQECGGEKRVYLNLTDASEDGVCEQLSESGDRRQCKCRKAGLFLWGEDVQIGSAFPILYVAGGGGAAAAFLLLTGGGGDVPSSGVSTTSTPAVTTPDPTEDFTCVFMIDVISVTDPADHLPSTGKPPAKITVVVTATSIQITGEPPWVDVKGTYNASTGAFNANGSGVVAGRNNVSVSFTGTISGNQIKGTLKWGTNGELPQNQPITFEIQGTKLQ